MSELEPRKSPELQARVDIWRPGVLFHNFRRFPREGKKVDRLRRILEVGIVPVNLDRIGDVTPDIRRDSQLTPGYDRTVFLHRSHPVFSQPYIPRNREVVSCFVNPSARIFTPDDVPSGWPVHSLDEVYVDGIILP